jgi:hypothetical protein
VVASISPPKILLKRSGWGSAISYIGDLVIILNFGEIQFFVDIDNLLGISGVYEDSESRCMLLAVSVLWTTRISISLGPGHYLSFSALWPLAYIYSKFRHGYFCYRLRLEATGLSYWHSLTISWIFCQRSMAYLLGTLLKLNVMAGLPTRTLRQGDYEGSPIPPCGDFARSASSVRTSPWLQQSTKGMSSPTS